jgi:hypothetical protein
MRWRFTALLSGLLLVGAARTGATVFVPTEWSEFVRAAGVIAHGRIAAVRPQVSADRRRIETIVTLQVATYLKGDWGATVTFRVPGGQVGRYRSIVLGAPVFEPGEEVVLLLGARGPSVPYVLGLSQGVFRITSEPGTGARHVTPVPVAGEGEAWTAVARGASPRGPLSLDDFAVQVWRILDAEVEP